MMTTGQDIFCLKLPHSLTSQFKYKWLAPRKEILGYQVTSRFTCQDFFRIYRNPVLFHLLESILLTVFVPPKTDFIEIRMFRKMALQSRTLM